MKSKTIFRLQTNTDGVDIREQCIGVDAWVVGDSVSKLNSKRGLHIQIKLNDDNFDEACELSRLVAAAPELLEALEKAYVELVGRSPEAAHAGQFDWIGKILVKTRGES